MGNVLQFRKPGTRMFPDAVVHELYALTSDIRELEIAQRRYVARDTRTPKSLLRQLVKIRSKKSELLEKYCTRDSAHSAKLALTLYGCLNHPDIMLIRGDESLFESVVRMHTDLKQIITRLFLWSYLTVSDQEKIQMISTYILKVQVRVDEHIIAEAG